MPENHPFESETAVSDGFDAEHGDAFDPETVELCEITNRVLVISPRPASLRSLVADLAVRCYDVLLLHHADDPLLDLMKGNVVIYDRTADNAAAAGPGDPSLAPAISLVRAAPAHPDAYGGHWVLWPSPIGHVIQRIKALAALLPAPPAVTDRSAGQLAFKDIALDPERMTVTRAGSKVDLTRTEFDLLRALLAAEGRVKSRDELIVDARGDSSSSEWGSNTIDVHIRSLRSKLEDDPRAPRYIATVRGSGYRLADG
ncbi:winged helix-turn-helix domain-containing protein [Cohnella sp. GCM10027633]|uniref:winged helix-turn-helix domain-containing protein n=1 Tax=unclassified Cohnella TaxID=2636738 RepID=UPI00362C8D5F